MYKIDRIDDFFILSSTENAFGFYVDKQGRVSCDKTGEACFGNLFRPAMKAESDLVKGAALGEEVYERDRIFILSVMAGAAAPAPKARAKKEKHTFAIFQNGNGNYVGITEGEDHQAALINIAEGLMAKGFKNVHVDLPCEAVFFTAYFDGDEPEGQRELSPVPTAYHPNWSTQYYGVAKATKLF